MASKPQRPKTFAEKVFFVMVIFLTVCMLAVAFTGLGANVLSSSTPTNSGAQPANATFGNVNGIPLSQVNFDNQLQSYENFDMQLGNTISPNQLPGIRSEIADQMIQDALLISEASKLGVSVSDADIQAERLKQVQQQGLAQKLSLPSTATLPEIDQALTSSGQPTTETMLPDDKIKDSLLAQKVHDTIDSQTVVTEASARAYYTQWRTSHILIGNKTRSDAGAKLQAQKILALATAPGADFAALAKQYSEDTGTKNKGGDDGWIDQSTQYVPEFKNAAFALQKGQISPQPVSSPRFGYFIIKCDDIRSNLPKDFDKNKANYISQLQSTERDQKFQIFVQMLKADPSTKIVITDPRLKGDQIIASLQNVSDPAARNMAFQAALADYQQALKSLNSVDAGDVNANIAAIYEEMGDTKDELPALKAAADSTHDSHITYQLGMLYLSSKDTTDAMIAFQQASSEGWNDESLHKALLNVYKSQNRPDLVQSEQAWFKNYQLQQQSAQAPAGLPPGAISVTPGGSTPVAAAVPANAKPVAVTLPANAKPVAVTVPASTTPAAGTPAPAGKKPAQ